MRAGAAVGECVRALPTRSGQQSGDWGATPRHATPCHATHTPAQGTPATSTTSATACRRRPQIQIQSRRRSSRLGRSRCRGL